MPDEPLREEQRQRLLALRSQLLGDSNQMSGEALLGDSKESSGNLSSVPQHMADRGSDAYEQGFTLGRLEDANDMIIEIDDALARLDEGAYGICEECGQAIGERRLRIRPHAALCVACQQQQEAEGGA